MEKIEDAFWITTDNGVVKTEIKKPLFKDIGGNKATILNFRGITEGPNGHIYFLNDHLYEWNPVRDTVSKYWDWFGNYNVIYSDSVVWRGHIDPNTLGGEVDLRTNKKTLYPTIAGEWAYTNIESQTPRKYLLGHSGGLSYLDLNNKISLPFEDYNEFEELKELDVFDFHRNDTGIWVATNKGIYLMTETAGVLRHFDKASGHLPFDYVNHIYEDTTDGFWLATGGGGLVRWQPDLSDFSSTEYQQYTTKDGLSNDYLYAVYGDQNEQLWVSSDRGLMQIQKNNFQVRTYTTNDGLPHNEFNFTSHYQTKDGQLYFGSAGGVITFHPDEIPKGAVFNAPLKFIGGKILKRGDTETMNLSAALIDKGKIIVKPFDKLYEIQISLLDFDNASNHRFSYQIAGYSADWVNIEENFIRFNDLAHGNYTLKVKAQNINKGWTTNELELKIQVLKPFYLKWWFILCSIVSFAGLITGIIKRREAKLIKDKNILEAEVKKRTQTIETQAEKLKELDKAKTRFFSNVTHEFRTPLTLIIGPLEQVLENQPPPKMFKRRLNGVLNNARHLLTLINQMLDISKIESGRMDTEVTRGDIVDYTKTLTQQFEILFEQKAQRFSFVTNQTSWETNFDKDKWNKIIYNLLSNAIKFTPEGKTIQLTLLKTTYQGQETIRLDVKDTGIGLHAEQLDKIFNRFYQVDDSSRRVQGGTGIGLALVKELVELQGGEIWVSSQPNKGTTFELYIPVLQITTDNERKKTVLAAPTLPILASNESGKVEKTPVLKQQEQEKLDLLLIEDNEEIREYIRYCLDTAQYNVIEARNGEEGLLKAQSIVPDLIISDVMMPKRDGFEVVQAIRENLATSHIPVILLTAKASLESRLEGLKRGADAYLTKPFSPKELVVRIEKLIELRQLIQQRYLSEEVASNTKQFEKEDQFIADLRAYILKNLDETKLNGDIIGSHFGMSRVHLYRKLKALTNQSISELVKQIRLEKAKALLLEGELNVSEITHQTGFSSISYFSRAFKKAYGKAPSEM